MLQNYLPYMYSITFRSLCQITAVAAVACSAVFFLSPRAESQALPVVDWIGGDGNFGVGTNWSTGEVPDDTERAVFNPVGPITVTLDQDREVASIQTFGSRSGEVESDVIFDLNSYHLQLTATGVRLGDRSFTMRGAASIQRSFTFENGTVTANQVFLQAVGIELPIHLRLRSGVTMNMGGTLEVISSNISVLGESVLNLGSDQLRASGTANLQVTGAGSKIQSSGSVTHYLGTTAGATTAGQATLKILEGASADLGRLNLGRDSTSSGNNSAGEALLLVDGTGTSFKAAQLNIAGGVNSQGINVIASSGDSFATFTNGATAQIELLRNFENGTLEIDDATVTVGAGGATLYAGSNLNLVIHSEEAMFITQALTITDSILNLSFADDFEPLIGQQIMLIEYTSLTGLFDGINQGGNLLIGETLVSFDYGSGTNDWISITVIPEPKTAAALFAIAGLLTVVFLRRRRRS